MTTSATHSSAPPQTPSPPTTSPSVIFAGSRQLACATREKKRASSVRAGMQWAHAVVDWLMVRPARHPAIHPLASSPLPASATGVSVGRDSHHECAYGCSFLHRSTTNHWRITCLFIVLSVNRCLYVISWSEHLHWTLVWALHYCTAHRGCAILQLYQRDLLY